MLKVELRGHEDGAALGHPPHAGARTNVISATLNLTQKEI